MTRVRPRGVLPQKKEPDYGSVHVAPGRSRVSIVVLGKPATQGSKNRGMQEANPRLKPWREAIALVCRKYLPADWEPLDGPLEVDMTFFFAPPKSAKRGDLPSTRATGDWDKIARGMGDGLVDGGVVVDDARFTDATVRKRYVWPEEGEARAVAVVRRAPLPAERRSP